MEQATAERSSMRIGEHLQDLSQLSEHDIQEILYEQARSGSQFGQVAVAWGLCAVEDLWRAWSRQLADGMHRIDLSRVGVDAQATATLCASVARSVRAIPIRIVDGVAIVAISERSPCDVVQQLEEVLQRGLRVVVADDAAVMAALERYYPTRIAM